jgi:hypothetical protein
MAPGDYSCTRWFASHVAAARWLDCAGASNALHTLVESLLSQGLMCGRPMTAGCGGGVRPACAPYRLQACIQDSCVVITTGGSGGTHTCDSTSHPTHYQYIFVPNVYARLMCGHRDQWKRGHSHARLHVPTRPSQHSHDANQVADGARVLVLLRYAEPRKGLRYGSRREHVRACGTVHTGNT